MFKRLSCLLLTCIIGITFSAAPSQASDKNLIIATATTGGTFYPVGVAIGTLISIKLSQKDKITATAINSAGSGENIQMLKNKEADVAILQALYGLNAYKGEGPYKGKAYKDFRSITMLWENVEHFPLLKKYAKKGNIEDLKNLDQKFSIGKRGSGSEGSGRTLLRIMEIDVDKDVILEFIGYTPSAQAMMDGRIAGANIPAGPPAAAITQLYAQLDSDDVTVLEFTDAQLAKIQEQYPIWNRYVIPAGTYPSQKSDIKTIAQPNFLTCRADLSDEVVYLMTKTIYENLSFLNNIHKATKAMSLERATIGLPVPLHPGAEKYYREVGIIK
ncbi:TAXI family TRAP transporter solute-binding subunit [Maridesulfovibrio ferrireducens]|uniref:TAXI family TRAP transporter solute-binding subunit n=1 Tax=Maridesulfovibrio ferrireducens TaxID=246191 RepID=UPI001A1A4CE1|nr:TAXI family TRAP transporter solute-binding subunit [Maridesulfovibrio ferrireducens]MBI9109708.1 TAXI family TRAP transporter solute-binding subunit [Maridesulfovibrio ferrireducens]